MNVLESSLHLKLLFVRGVWFGLVVGFLYVCWLGFYFFFLYNFSSISNYKSHFW